MFASEGNFEKVLNTLGAMVHQITHIISLIICYATSMLGMVSIGYGYTVTGKACQ